MRGDAALLLAGGDQLPQHAEVDTALVVLKDGLLRIFQAVDEAAVQGGSLELMSSDLPTKSSSLLRAEEALSARYDCSSSWYWGPRCW